MKKLKNYLYQKKKILKIIQEQNFPCLQLNLIMINYVLDAKLYNNYEMKEDKMYTITMVPDDIIKAIFKSRKKFDELKVNCVSLKMKPFRIFLTKKDPSSSNTIRSNLILFQNYYNYIYF